MPKPRHLERSLDSVGAWDTLNKPWLGEIFGGHLMDNEHVI
jgi:hypothetical protein